MKTKIFIALALLAALAFSSCSSSSHAAAHNKGSSWM